MTFNNWAEKKSLDIRFKKIVKLCKFKDNDKILDVGCRTMLLKKYLPEKVKYTGADINTFGDIIKIDLNKDKLPFKEDYFDFVFCLEVLEHINNPHYVLSELNRVSKKYIIISVPNPYHYRDVGKHLFKMPDKQGHINSFIYPNIWRHCEDLEARIKKIKGSFLLPFIPTNNLLLSRHLIFLIKKK